MQESNKTTLLDNFSIESVDFNYFNCTIILNKLKTKFKFINLYKNEKLRLQNTQQTPKYH